MLIAPEDAEWIRKLLELKDQLEHSYRTVSLDSLKRDALNSLIDKTLHKLILHCEQTEDWPKK